MKRFSLILILFICFLVWPVDFYTNTQNSKKCSVLIEGSVNTIFGRGFIIGTGVIIDSNGLIITAKHCVENINNLRITLQDGNSYDVNDVILDKDSDIALIKLNTKIKNFAKIGDSNELDYGNIIYGIGTAKGIFDNYVSIGYVYKNHFKRMYFGDNDFILARMKVYSGCSGGGVYRYNKLIGIIIASNDGYSYIISSSEINKFLKEIKDVR